VSAAISRMQFLRGDYSGRDAPIRPPWSGTENEFTQQCDACGECVERCPTKIIHKGRAGYPIIKFDTGECLFCGDCVDACETNALAVNNNQLPWAVTAFINTGNCLAHKNTECRSCYDPCEAKSISMIPRLGGVTIPTLNTSLCTGCGACFAVCPTQAISMTKN